MDSSALRKATDKYISVAQAWSVQANNRDFFTEVWPNDGNYNHFFTKMKDSKGDGFKFLNQLDPSNFGQAISAVVKSFDRTEMLIGKDFYLYLDCFGSRWNLTGDFLTRYNALDEVQLDEIMNIYFSEGHYLRV